MKTFKLFNFNLRSSAKVQAEGCTKFLSSLCLILTMLFTLGVGEMGAITVYFKNTPSWSNVYVTFLTSSYWDGTNGSGAYGYTSKQMTYDSTLGLYKCTFTGSYSVFIAFTKDNQSGYGNFYNTEAVYRGDYSTSSPIYIPSSTSNETKNGTKYYNTGQWVSTTQRTIYLATNWANPKAYCWNSYGEQFAWSGQAMTLVSGKTYDGKAIYSYTTKYDAANIKFSNNGSSGTADLVLGSTNAGKLYNGSSWVTYECDHVIKSGSTVVWDLAGDNADYWPNTYMYRIHYAADAEYDTYTKLANNQRYKTYASDTYCKSFLFTKDNPSSWTDWRFTTDITGANCDVDGITLFTYDNTTTTADGHNKLNWQITKNAKKGTDDVKVYFDNTNTSWSKIYFKYGTDWFNRSIAYTMTKVTGTANLYVLELPQDIYYKEYFLSAEAGTNANNYENIETATGITKRTAFQAFNLAADSTIIPATGTGTPKVSTVTKIAGHTRQVSITEPSHGTITVAYTNESGTAQSPTSGNFNVAQTCSLAVSSDPATGYERSTLKINDSDHTSGDVYIIREDITVAATFTAKETTVTLNANTANHGSGDNQTVTATYDAAIPSFTHTSAATGYYLTGYYTGATDGDMIINANGAYTSNSGIWNRVDGATLTLYAHYAPNTYTLNLTHNIATNSPTPASITVTYDANTNLTGDVLTKKPTNANYTFQGYYTSDGGGGSLLINTSGAVQNVTNYTSSGTWVKASDATVYAKWTQSITLNQNGATTDGSTSLAATYNAVLDASGITNPSKTGYTFDGWTTAQNSGSVVINASKAVQTVASWTDGSKKWIHNAASTLYAKWTAIDYNVTYSAPSNGNYTIKVASGTASSATKTANYAQTITIAATPTTGYHFVSWTIKKTSDNSDVTSSVSLSSSTNKDATFTMPAYGVTVTATFAINTYAISYAAGTYGSGSLAGGTKTYGVSYTLSSSSSAFTRTGYTYDGWSTNAAGSSKDYNLGGSYTTNAAQTFYPHWVVTNYTIGYTLNGGSVAVDNPTSYTIESSAITLNNPTKTGYTFAGWTGTGLASATTTVTIAAGSTGNRSYTATWTANTNTAYTVKHYKQKLDGTYDATPDDTDNLTGTTASSVTPAVKSYEGFTAPSTQTKTIAADGTMVIEYKYTRNSYTLTWALDGGSISSAGTAAGSVKYGASLTAPTVTKTGYTFSAWSPTVPATMPAANSTYTATWSEKSYTVTFYNGGHGTVAVASVTIDNGGTASVNHFTTKTLVATANTGYKFTEWTNTGSVTIGNTANASTTITATATGGTVTATWTAKQCTVTFNKDGGEGGDDDVTATYGSAMTNVSVPHKIGYKFAGYWDGTGGTGTQYYNANGTSARTWNKDTESATTLYAKWTSDTNTFTGVTNTNWSTNSNWSSGTAPTNDYSTVTISSNVTIADGTTAHVGEILISAGSLTIQPGGALEVAGTIKKFNGDPTETTDIIINTSDTKQASLILDNSAADTKATVLVTSTAAKEEDTYSFQYIAVPMTSVSVQHSFSGQGIYTYVWNEGTGWERRNYYYDLYAFEGVGLTQASASGYGLTGTLATTNNQTFALTYTSETAGAGMNMIGNSWTSPISIAALHGKITGNATSTVYVYDSKTGTWLSYPTGSAGAAVVPAMQAYLILATSGGGSLQLNYDEAVRGVASANRTPALRAPKREVMEMSDIYLHVSDNNVSTDLRLCEAEQFTNAFDNGWEAIYIEGEGRSGQLYAQTDEKMAVLATPSLEGTVVGFIPGNAANYTISFSGTETGYYLNDMLMEQSTLITEDNTYEFVPDENTNATRFVISKTPIMKTPTGVEDNEQTEINNVRKLIINDKLYIIRAGRIYNATGALVK